MRYYIRIPNRLSFLKNRTSQVNLNLQAMKKNKISFESYFWAAERIKCPFKLVNAFYDYANLHFYKHTLGEVIIYSHKRNICMQDNPGQIFVFYTAMNSFLKACYCMKSKRKKWHVKKSDKCESNLLLASLTKEEYNNPFIVFEKAFAEKTPEEFEFFLGEIVHLSLSPCAEDYDFDKITPYLYLIKMLDASQLIRERGVEKIKKTAQGE